jgi:DUF4097 and DUF4098 domain-containing protein YvlB
MSEERTKILEMLAEGKISADEANLLLEALKEKPSSSKGIGFGHLFEWFASLFGARARFSEEQDWTLDGAGVSLIKAQTDNGGISLQGADQDQVTVQAKKEIRAPTEEKAKEFAQQVQIHVERDGNEIHIYKEHPRPPLGTTVAVRYNISALRAVGANLRTSNGAVHIQEIDGAVEAVTSNGAVELQGGAGEVKLHTSNGAIQIQDATGHIHAETSNGKIGASLGLLEEATFLTSNGSIDVKVREGNAPVTAKTSNGSIHLTLPADFAGQLDAKTTNGRVHSELPVSVTEGERNRLVGQIGEGGETTVKLRTLNGSIHLKAQQ